MTCTIERHAECGIGQQRGREQLEQALKKKSMTVQEAADELGEAGYLIQRK
jgi:hypothetical protein